MNAVNIGLIGLGTVGSGTLLVLQRNAEEISRRAGREIKIIAAAVRDLSKPRDVDTTGIHLTEDISEIVNHPDIQVVVEVAGGGGVILDAALQALDNGKHLVTANKELIATHGNSLFEKSAMQRADGSI